MVEAIAVVVVVVVLSNSVLVTQYGRTEMIRQEEKLLQNPNPNPPLTVLNSTQQHSSSILSGLVRQSQIQRKEETKARSTGPPSSGSCSPCHSISHACVLSSLPHGARHSLFALYSRSGPNMLLRAFRRALLASKSCWLSLQFLHCVSRWVDVIKLNILLPVWNNVPLHMNLCEQLNQVGAAVNRIILYSMS